MEPPAITWKQILVLETLMSDGWVSGRTIRDSLEQHGASMARQSFYAMMANMEKGPGDISGLVQGKYEDVEDQEFSLRQRFYRITGRGRLAYQETLEFWQQRIDALEKVKRSKSGGKRKKKS